MKTVRFFFVALLVAFFASVNGVKAQSFQKIFHIAIDVPVGDAWCLNRPVVGEYSYKLTYHLNPLTGKITNMQANTMGGKVYDAETGERYVVIDVTGNDKIGYWWAFFNRPNESNGVPDESLYDVKDGWLDAFMPDELPAEGGMVYSTLRFIGKNFKVSMHIVMQVHRNANGEVTAEVYKERLDCNE